jgi:cation:H+ antiporter
MSPILAVLALILGFWLLIKGADWLVDGGSAIARRFQVKELVIGLTIVSLGTSLPELMVSVAAGLRGASELVIGNVIGSNIMNTLLVLGAAGLVATKGLPFSRNTVLREIPFSLLAGLVLLVLANDAWFADGVWRMLQAGVAHLPAGTRLPAGFDAAASAGVISRGDGLILLAFFAIFTAYVIAIARESGEPEPADADAPKELSVARSAGLVALGAAALAGGGHLAVDGGVAIAEWAGVSQKLIGLLLLAGGTSLPELVTSVVAVRKGRPGIAVGNVLGSNIANIFFVLGLAATLTPVAFERALNTDLGLVILSSAVLLAFMFRGSRGAAGRGFAIERGEALVFLLAYLAYGVFLFLRA